MLLADVSFGGYLQQRPHLPLPTAASGSQRGSNERLSELQLQPQQQQPQQQQQQQQQQQEDSAGVPPSSISSLNALAASLGDAAAAAGPAPLPELPTPAAIAGGRFSSPFSASASPFSTAAFRTYSRTSSSSDQPSVGRRTEEEQQEQQELAQPPPPPPPQQQQQQQGNHVAKRADAAAAGRSPGAAAAAAAAVRLRSPFEATDSQNLGSVMSELVAASGSSSPQKEARATDSSGETTAEVLAQCRGLGQEGGVIRQLEALRCASIKLASSADVDVHLLPPAAKAAGQQPVVLALHEHV
jgi:hypothetical protein